MGCGNGGLDWADVWPLIDRYLDELRTEIEVWVPVGEEADDLAPSVEPQPDLFSE